MELDLKPQPVQEARVARIDMGHAFNDLIKNVFTGSPKGGGVLDSINREHVNYNPKHLFNEERKKTKLRRYNEDFLLDPEFVDALKSTQVDENKLKNTIAECKETLLAASEGGAKLNNQMQDELISLGRKIGMSDAAMAEPPGFFGKLIRFLGLEKIFGLEKEYDHSKERINAVLDGVEQFMINNQKEAQSVANVLDVQRTVKLMIEGKIPIDKGMETISTIYQKDEKYLKGKDFAGVGADSQVEWVRVNDEDKLVKQSLSDYIKTEARKALQAEGIPQGKGEDKSLVKKGNEIANASLLGDSQEKRRSDPASALLDAVKEGKLIKDKSLSNPHLESLETIGSHMKLNFKITGEITICNEKNEQQGLTSSLKVREIIDEHDSNSTSPSTSPQKSSVVKTI